MTDNNISPLPWRVYHSYYTPHGEDIVDICGETRDHTVVENIDKELAEYIVEACNNYAALKEQNTKVWEMLEEVHRKRHDAYNKIAPLLGLKPFYGTCNKEQIIWANSQEEANSLKAGGDIFTFVEQLTQEEEK